MLGQGYSGFDDPPGLPSVGEAGGLAYYSPILRIMTARISNDCPYRHFTLLE
jgi:hypothetical protein